MDETPVQVMKEPGRTNTQKSYMWLARGGPPDSPLVIYNYQRTRGSDFIKEFLDGYSGYLQTDGYRAYQSALKNNEDIVHVGCLAHVRRKFHDAAKASKKTGGAHEALSRIQKIYRKEDKLHKRELDETTLLAEREAQVFPMLVQFQKWLDNKILIVRPESDFGKAIRYALGEWERVSNYIKSPYLTPDNNAAERSIKPFVIGRKNWLFSGSPRGAEASSFFYSMIETAKVNALNPYGYLKWVFETAPTLDENNYESLLRWNCDRENVNRYDYRGLKT